MNIHYKSSDDFPGWGKAPHFIQSLLFEHNCRRILEVGSGANPTMTPDFIQKEQLTYVTSDLSKEELEKADPAFGRLVLDLSQPSIEPGLSENFDCVFSRMVNEHVRDGRQYHENIYKILRPGGISVHFFSTLWTIPFIANRLLPESLGDILVRYTSPWRSRHQYGKFKAYYSWSRGPSDFMVERLQSLGFEILNYTGYFGHYYYSRLTPVHRLEKIKSNYLLRHPVPQLCSYATLVLRKPMQGSA
jgi:SAM-dependent methyltransferase